MNRQRNTRPLFRRIAIVFDFDGTLGPDTMSCFVESLGIDPESFWSQRVHPRIAEGWDPIPAAFCTLIEESRSRPEDDRVTRERLAASGREYALFTGVPELFDRVRWTVHETNPDVEVEFYLVSCGIGEIIRNTPIAAEFQHVWACEFDYDESGAVRFVKRIISHTEKTRYLYQVSRGLPHREGVGKPFSVNHEVPQEKLHVPLNQLIYVGDGLTDVPCFSLLHQEKGISIGLYKQSTREKWGPQSDVGKGQRVSNLAPVDYREDSELVESLMLAVKSLCYQIELRERSIGE